MKIKMFALAALVSVAGFASAQSVSISYADRNYDAGGGDHLTGLSVKSAAYGAFTGDVGLSVTQNDSTNALVSRTEAGVTYTHQLPLGLKGDFRVAHGFKMKSGTSTTQYYVLEPSVTSKLGATPLSVKVGYRVRNAYADNVADNSKTTRLAVAYALTAKDSVSLGRDWLRGDGALTQTTLQYTRAF